MSEGSLLKYRLCMFYPNFRSTNVLSEFLLLYSHLRHAVTVNPQVYALTYGLSPALIFFMFALIYRFGAFLVTLPDGHILQESFIDVFTVSIVIIFGTLAIAQASAFAPNYAKAKISSNRIFFLLDRQPVIDNYSEDGEKLVSIVSPYSTQGCILCT